MVPEIQPSLLSTTLVQPLASSPSKDKNDLLEAVKALYVMRTIHSLIMQSWKTFRSGQKEIAEQNNKEHEALQRREAVIRAAEMEGEKRHVELFDVEKRQASHLSVWEGPYQGSASNLNFAV